MSKELEQNIAEIEKQLKEMKAELKKSKKFEWKYPKNKTYSLDEWSINENYSGLDEDWLRHGRYRISKQYAKHSLERNRVANRLEALVEQIEPDYVVPESRNDAYYIYLNNNMKYTKAGDTTIRVIGQIYMSEATATKICELLNSGEVVL